MNWHCKSNGNFLKHELLNCLFFSVFSLQSIDFSLPRFGRVTDLAEKIVKIVCRLMVGRIVKAKQTLTTQNIRNPFFWEKKLDICGIDPRTSRMLSERSIIPLMRKILSAREIDSFYWDTSYYNPRIGLYWCFVFLHSKNWIVLVLSFFKDLFTYFHDFWSYNGVVILAMSKQEEEWKSEWFCGVKFFRSNFKVVKKLCLNKNSLSR